MIRTVGKLGVVLAVGSVFMLGCDKSNPVTSQPPASLPDTTGRVVVFSDGFEGDLSNWKSNYMLNMGDYYPQMRITTPTAHGGTHSLTTDSNRTALILNTDSTAAFPKLKVIESGVAGAEFYFMAQSAGGINFTIQLGKYAGSSGGLGYLYGIGFDTSNNLKCTKYDAYNDIWENTILTPLVANHWYKGTIEVSFTSKKVTYYLDGKLVATKDTHDPGLLGIDRLLVFRGLDGAEGAKPYFVDDIKLYTK